jgi:hypothetical protein
MECDKMTIDNLYTLWLIKKNKINYITYYAYLQQSVAIDKKTSEKAKMKRYISRIKRLLDDNYILDLKDHWNIPPKTKNEIRKKLESIVIQGIIIIIAILGLFFPR